MTVNGHLIEIFSSLQGEGLHVGKAMTFVRLQGCRFGCHWCDTPESFKTFSTVRVETPAGSEHFRNEMNPVTPEMLNAWLSAFRDPWISVTGGEPLEQCDFLEAWLPTTTRDKRILLETNGIHGGELDRIVEWIDVISMDIKLPSSAGTREVWKEHDEFLHVALESRKQLYVKIVVTGKTKQDEVQRAFELVASYNKRIPVILQPVSDTRTFSHPIATENLHQLTHDGRTQLARVEVIPQMHKIWGVL